MINLLPPEEKAKLIFEKKKKLTLILGVSVIIPLLCFILILLSIRFYILGEINAQETNLEQARKEYQTDEFLNFKDIMGKNDKIMTKLEKLYKQDMPLSEVLTMVSAISRPPNLYLTNVVVAITKEQKIKVTVSGFAPTREDLLTFQKNINENKRIQNGWFSPESWVNPKDVKFNATFEVK